MKHSGRWVAYYRVSTKRQGESGLGLEAQRAAVEAYLNGGRWKLIAEFTEVESGRQNERPELLKALAACRVHGARLLVAKLDRLSRNAAFLLTLRDAGVDFVCADMPEADTTMIGFMAVIAQREREMISRRTKEALAAAKARGVRLGNPAHLTREGTRRGVRASVAVRQARAAQRAADLAPVIADLRASGVQTLQGLARGLAERHIPTARGGTWTATQVRNTLARMPVAS